MNIERYCFICSLSKYYMDVTQKWKLTDLEVEPVFHFRCRLLICRATIGAKSSTYLFVLFIHSYIFAPWLKEYYFISAT